MGKKEDKNERYSSMWNGDQNVPHYDSKGNVVGYKANQQTRESRATQRLSEEISRTKKEKNRPQGKKIVNKKNSGAKLGNTPQKPGNYQIKSSGCVVTAIAMLGGATALLTAAVEAIRYFS